MATGSYGTSSQIVLNVNINPQGAVQGARVVSTSVQGMQNSVAQSTQQMQQSFRSLESFIKRSTGAIAGFMATVTAIDGIKTFLDRMVDVNKVYTQFIATIGVVRGSASAAREEFEYLIRVSNKMGQQAEANSMNYMRLAASMKYLDKTGEATRHVFEAVASASSVLHLKGFESNRILVAFEQMLSKGKLSLEELQRQLANTLPDAMGMAARSMEMTKPQFLKAVRDNAINPLEFVLKIANQIKAEYGPAVEYASSQFIGSVNRMRNAVMVLYRDLGNNGAMQGLVEIVNVITEKLSDPYLVENFGQAIGSLFSNIAQWLNKITGQDLADFVNSMVEIGRTVFLVFAELAGGIGKTINTKLDFITFGEIISEMIFNVSEVVRVMVNSLMLIPRAIQHIVSGVRLAKEVLNPANMGFGRTQEQTAQYEKKIKSLEAERDRTRKNLHETADVVFNNATLTGPRLEMRDRFAKLRAERLDREKNGASKGSMADVPIDTGVMDPSKIDKFIKDSPLHKPIESGGSGSKRDVFSTERLNLIKMISTAEQGYANSLDGLSDKEDRNLAIMVAKLDTDKQFIKLSQNKKDQLIELAKLADQAVLMEEGAKAYKQDMMQLDKDLFQAELSLADAYEGVNGELFKNIRAFEEKLLFEAKYKTFTESMVEAERKKATALDETLKKLNEVSKLEQSRMDTRLLNLQVEREFEKLGRGFGSQQSETNTLDDEIKAGKWKGHSEEFLNDMRGQASKRDSLKNESSAGKMSFDFQEQLRQMEFEIELIGRTKDEQKLMVEARRLDQWYRQQGIDLTLAENRVYRDQAELLMDELASTLDTLRLKKEDFGAGVRDGLTTYLDDISDYAGSTAKVVTSALQGIQGGLTELIMGGKFEFEDFAKRVIAGLVDVMVQMMIMQPIVDMLKTSMSASSGGGGGGGFWGSLAAAFFGGGDAGSSAAASSAPGVWVAKGGVFYDGQMSQFKNGGSFLNGVVTSPTRFDIGEMGEAGPEAVMPLSRDSSGRLGVKSSADPAPKGGDTNVQVVQHIRVDSRSDQATIISAMNRAKDAAIAEIRQSVRRGDLSFTRGA